MYYHILFSKEQKLSEMKMVGFNVEELMSCGVLLDTEADVDEDSKKQCENHRYRNSVYI